MWNPIIDGNKGKSFNIFIKPQLGGIPKLRRQGGVVGDQSNVQERHAYRVGK